MTKFIDLDKVVPSVVTIKYKDVIHELKPVTVKLFAENMKDLQELGTSPGIEQELELSIRVLSRAFPTMTRDMLDALTLEQMNSLINLAHNINGQAESAEEAKKANPPAADQPSAA